MKTSSRPIDHLGRIVLPIGIRRALDIHEKDRLEIYMEDNRIIMEKVQISCCFCDGGNDLTDFGGKRICRTCLDKLKNM